MNLYNEYLRAWQAEQQLLNILQERVKEIFGATFFHKFDILPEHGTLYLRETLAEVHPLPNQLEQVWKLGFKRLFVEYRTGDTFYFYEGGPDGFNQRTT